MRALAPDAGHRRYWRVARGAHTAVLVEDGQSLPAFLRMAEALRAHGFAAPEAYAAVPPFALLEDFGDRPLRALPMAQALPHAVDVLRHFAACPDLLHALDLPHWAGSALQQKRGDFAPPSLAPSFESVWAEAESALPPYMPVFTHADFHPDNLMALPDGRVGLLDFQDALAAHPAYDLVNLLEDARTDVPKGLRADMLQRYCAGMTPEDRRAFEVWYRVLGTQFHCRVWALFLRLGGTYAAHLPRLEAYIREALPHPALGPVARWFTDHAPAF